MVHFPTGFTGQRLLSSPSNATSLLKSFGYRAVEVEGEQSSRGHIIRAHRISDNLPVVVKSIRRDSVEAHVLVAFREVQSRGERLPIPSVLNLIGDASSNIVLAVQEDWGQTLAELGPLPPSEFFHIILQCFEAVVILHAKGIAHLDISIYNFLCNANRRVALIDFEMSRRIEIKTRLLSRNSQSHLVYPQRTTETPPEFRTPDAHTRQHCAYKLDIFALGVLILRFAKASGFDCPQLVRLAEPLIECNPASRPTAAEAVLWFRTWCERVGVVISN
ncbi:Tyrosine kinase specific for activated [Ceratobasidium sp. AG-Ba]|nr:Tyrosine kinase specific for activated [Ceratobasidium sp. AG-Ba]